MKKVLIRGFALINIAPELEQIESKSDNDLIKILKQAIIYKNIVTLSSKEEGKIKDKAICTNHQYALIDYQIFDNIFYI